MTFHMFGERRVPLLFSVERFIRPSHVEGDHLVGYAWSPELHREVTARAFLPRTLDADEAIEAAAAGKLVLERGLRRLTRAGF